MELKVGDWVEVLQEGADASCVDAGTAGVIVLLEEDDEFGMINVEFKNGLIQYYFADQLEKI